MTLVGAPRLSELCLVTRHVEDVVDDLEHDAELGREAPERDCGRSVDALERQDAADRRRDQRAGLQLVQVAQVRRRSAPATSRNCPPTMPRDAGGGHDLA